MKTPRAVHLLLAATLNPLGLLGQSLSVSQPEADNSAAAQLASFQVAEGLVVEPFATIEKLSRSERVKQVFVRHAFRYWMGRNETIDDAPVLQDAYQAYEASGGSMKALLLSLLTSDAFLYRTKS